MPDYWDSSCLLKLYCQETDSAAFREKIAASSEPPVSSVLAKTELSHAFQHKAARGETGNRPAAEFLRFLEKDIRLGRLQFFPVGSDVLKAAEMIAAKCYGTTEPIFLRTLDGIHLATAQLTKSARIISTDARMNAAAQILGMRRFTD
ncbi:MAG TPA: type II toxin-antitoxin system VapC family toxin [Opitutales bacterium]|nr:type II toxin-antitoxin system VapC family toxin [Opitutales bacterium]